MAIYFRFGSCIRTSVRLPIAYSHSGGAHEACDRQIFITDTFSAFEYLMFVVPRGLQHETHDFGPLDEDGDLALPLPLNRAIASYTKVEFQRHT